MYHHIVLFKLNTSLGSEEKLMVMNRFKKEIEALPAEISYIRQVSVNFNVNPTESWDIALVSCFDTLDDVRNYGSHPLHQQAASALKPYIESRACVDFGEK